MTAENSVPLSAHRKPTALTVKPDFERCLERIEAWFHHAVLDRPPVRFHLHNAQFVAEEGHRPRNRWPSLEARWLDAEYQVESFEREIAHKPFPAETFPVFVPNLGPSVYSAFYAGRLEFAENTSWFEPVITDLADFSGLRQDPRTNPYFQKIEEMTRLALERSNGRYWVGYTDLHPGLDCAAAWLGVDALFLTMMTEPEKLEPVLKLSSRDFRAIFEHFDSLLREAGHPSGTWINIPCRGRFHIPSCDTSSMISPEFFRQFGLPPIRMEMPGIDRAVFHMDGKGVAQHLDIILEQPNIQAIQWVQGVGTDEPILQWIPLLRRILSAGKSVHVNLKLNELDDFIEQMPREGVFLCLSTPQGAEQDVLRRIERW